MAKNLEGIVREQLSQNEIFPLWIVMVSVAGQCFWRHPFCLHTIARCQRAKSLLLSCQSSKVDFCSRGSIESKTPALSSICKGSVQFIESISFLPFRLNKLTGWHAWWLTQTQWEKVWSSKVTKAIDWVEGLTWRKGWSRWRKWPRVTRVTAPWPSKQGLRVVAAVSQRPLLRSPPTNCANCSLQTSPPAAE